MASAKFLPTLCILGFVSFVEQAAAAQAQCQFEQLSIQPLVAEKLDVFAGSAQQIEVRFINVKEQGDIEVFPEAPMTIRDLRSGKQCEVDGGVWVRKDVYLGAQGKTLMTHEYSGSNAFLMFYDTRSCRKLTEIDISTRKWALVSSKHGTQLSLSAADRPAQTKTIPFNLLCLPKQSLKKENHGSIR